MSDISLEEAMDFFLKEQNGVAVFDKFVFIDKKMFNKLMKKAQESPDEEAYKKLQEDCRKAYMTIYGHEGGDGAHTHQDKAVNGALRILDAALGYPYSSDGEDTPQSTTKEVEK